MRFLEVLKLEAKLIFTDIAIVLTIIGGVILYSFLYPQPYAKESVSSLPISIVDLDKSDISRSIIFALNATPQVSVVREDLSQKDALEAMERTVVKGLVVIPPHFKRDLTLGISPTIAVGADSSYFLIYGAVLESAMRAVLTESAKIKIGNLLKGGMPISEAKEAYTPYSTNTINLFNKNSSYTEYVIPAVFVLILQQTLIIGLGVLGGGVNERRKKGEKLHYRSVQISHVMLSRIVIFGTLFFIHMLFYFGFSYENFHITHIAKIEELLSFGVVFLLATIMFGLFLGSLFSSREIATPAILFSSLPLIFSVGFIWPIETIPPFIKYLSYLAPSTPAIDGFLKLNQMGASLDMLHNETALLLVQTLLYATLFIFIEKKRNTL